MEVGRGWGIPDWITGRVGLCPTCKTEELIFELKDAKGTYFQCMICGVQFEKCERVQ